MRLTLAELKAAVDWSATINLCTTDTRFLAYLNQALHRLMNAGHWVGTTQIYRFCTNRGTITLPRQFQTFEVAGICNQPVPIRNQWYEFLENGPGIYRSQGNCSGDTSCGTGSCGHYGVLDRGRGYAAFGDLPYDSTRIRIYLTQSADAGKYLTIRGYNSSGQYAQTLNGTVEGEALLLTHPYADTTTLWAKQVLRHVIKPITRGFLRVFAYDSTEDVTDPLDYTLCPIAVWEPSETLPDYRRYLIPALDGCEETRNVDVIARLQHVPIVSDLDFLPLGNVAAIKLAMMGIVKEERGDYAGARALIYGTFDPILRKFVNGAIPILEDELAAYQGAGTVSPVRITRDEVDRAGVLNMI